MSPTFFAPLEPLVDAPVEAACRACVIVPARNEEDSLGSTLDALSGQVDGDGRALPSDTFEVILLLNNCTDDSAGAVRRWHGRNPSLRLHVAERTLPPEQAFVGTARRMLMDTAWHRTKDNPAAGILSTDSDTVVAPDWVFRNLAALAGGADAVGGVIALKRGDFASLPPGAQAAYRRDRRFQRLVAELESMLDPQPGDPWPRHLEHFGASLACTPAIYALAGGLPPVNPLEDVAFVDALRRIDARLRHDPAVVVRTSSRLDGRADVGLSFQLRLWQQMSEEGIEHRVPTCESLSHRFRLLRELRAYFKLAGKAPPLCNAEWKKVLHEARPAAECTADFLARIDCNRMIEESFTGDREGEVSRVNREIAGTIRRLRGAGAGRAGSPLPASA